MKILFAILTVALIPVTYALDKSDTSSSMEGEEERYIEIFRQGDIDKDKSLNPEEAEVVGLSGASFRSLDKDRNGYLNLAEFLTMLPEKTTN